MSTQVTRPTIPAGNDFRLFIHLDKFNDGQYEEFDLHTATDLHVYLTCAVHNTEIDLDYTITSSNCLRCDVDYRLLHASTSYGVVVEGYDENERHFRWTMMPREGILVVPNTSGMHTDEDIQTIDLQGRVGWGIQATIHADWAEDDPEELSYIENKPDLSQYATIQDLDDKQDTLQSGVNIKTINNLSLLGSGNIDIQGGGTQVQANWNETDTTSPAYIQNKPNMNDYATTASLASVATSGNYNDLSNKPTIPASPVQSNWNESDSSSLAYIQNKPDLSRYQETLISGTNIKTINGNDILGSGDLVISGGYKPYEERYLTFTALQDTTFTFSRNALQYSLDDGSTWTTLSADTASPTVTAGNKILWKQTGLIPGTTNPNYGIGTFSATGNFEASGNIMSLYYGDNFIGQTDLTGKDYAFFILFNGNNKLVNAGNLILPATTLTEYCYGNMFWGCTSLTTAPELPATTLTEYCYGNMFWGCTSLTTAPELPATTLANYCYNTMFSNCTSLTTTPALPATTLANHCYENMFLCCTSLTTAPEILPATTLTRSCYLGMFMGCRSLITAPELPATTAANQCYQYMFDECTSLKTAPALPATTLAEACYYYMFYGCTSLTTAPELPATTLAQICYGYMFDSCISLNYIKCLATDISARNCTHNWVNGITTTGTFITSNNTPAWTTGTSGIPSGWTSYTEAQYDVVRHYELSNVATSGNYNDLTNKPTIPASPVQSNWNESDSSSLAYIQNKPDLSRYQETLISGTNIKTINGNSVLGSGDLVISGGYKPYEERYLTFTALQDTTFTFTTNALQYSLDNGVTWTTLAANTASPTVTAGNKILWKQTGLTPTSSAGIGTLSATGNFEASGNIMSLYYGDNFIGQTSLSGKNYAFRNLFNGNTKLINAENLILPATTLANFCYNSMFSSCTALTTVPELPATTLAERCYLNMFSYCTSLASAPELPATTLANACYQTMFEGCTSFTAAPELPATTLANYCYANMFRSCTSLIIAPELPATTLAQYCYGGMFSGCTKLNYIKCLATNISASNCTNNWVQNVAATGTFITSNNTPAWTTGTAGIPSGWMSCTEAQYDVVRHYELSNVATSGNYNDLSNKPDLSNYATQSDLSSKQDTLISGTNIKTINGNSVLGSGDLVISGGYKPYEERYLTFTALQDTTFTFTTNALQYSLDDGSTWTTLAADTASPTVTAGNKILWKQTELTPASNTGIGTFSATGNFEASGNIMSLLFGDNFIGETSLSGKNYAFRNLFNNNTKLVNTENLILPATTLETQCYINMFIGCTSLTTAPELPATTLTTGCYQQMFFNCTSLTTAPELPATTLANQCYSGMFNGCTSLTTAPELPATTLAIRCYQQMFYNCTSLTTAPELLATTLTHECYSGMFRGCTALTTAPELYATTLATSCYINMFYGCTLLNYIKCLATDISASNCTTNWVNSVAVTGTFVKADSMSSWTTGTSGIPSGWTSCTEAQYEVVRHYELSNVATSGNYNDLTNKPDLTYKIGSTTQNMQIEVVNALPATPDSNTLYIVI